MRWTRRSFLESSAALAATMAVPAVAASSDPAPSTREPLRHFGYADVQLTFGPLAEQYAAMHSHYLSLSNDSLLKVYRQRAGLAAPGGDMGGWYDLDGFVPGHSLGQYISGLARVGASTGDPLCHQKVNELVEGFAATLGPKNESILRPATNLWTCYILDKHFAGLVDASSLSLVPGAPELLNRVLNGAAPLLPVRGCDRIGKKNPPYDETFVMPENLFLAADLTGNPAFTQLAQRYLLDHELFDPLAAGLDPFPGQHAYSHAIALSSAGQAYLVEGNPKYRAAMEQAFKLLTTTQQFASGGWGPNETFITPHRGELHAALTTTVDHFETPCGAYAATKLARYLIRTTPSPEQRSDGTAYADNLERVIFNTILAVRPPDSEGDYPYYSTYSAAAQKVYYQKKWPCCSGTLIQTVADYPLNLYFQADSGIYAMLYASSKLSFTHRGTAVKLTQETRYPAADTTTLTLTPAHPVEMTLYLRVPAWTTQPAVVTVNGQRWNGVARPGSFAALRRTWRAGDEVTLTLAQNFRTEAIDDRNPDTVALMRGPLQYVALGTEPPTLAGELKPVGPQRFRQSSRFRQSRDGREVEFVPLHQTGQRTYTSYFSKV